MYPQHPHPPQGLPLPADQIIQGQWINDPISNPPPCPKPGPGAAQGVERVILGSLLDVLQRGAMTGSPVRIFGYNLLSMNNYDNNDFRGLLDTVLVLTAALLDSGDFQRASQAAEFAASRMSEFQFSRMTNSFPVLRNMDPPFASEEPRIHQIGQELGQLIRDYQQHLRNINPPPQQNHFGGGAQYGTPPPTAGRFGHTPPTSPSGRFGHQNTASAKPATHSTGISTDIYKPPAPKAPDASVRSNVMSGNALLDLYVKKTTDPTETNPPRGSRPAPQPTPVAKEHPTGNTVHRQSPRPTDDAPDDVQWLVNSDEAAPQYLTPTPSVEGNQTLLYERKYLKPAYRITNGSAIESTVTERDVPMSAGYDLHELAFKKNALEHRNWTGKSPEVYVRGDLLKADTIQEIEEEVPYYQESIRGGALSATTLLTLDAQRLKLNDPDAVSVILYEERRPFYATVELREMIKKVRAGDSLEIIASELEHLGVDYPVMYQYLEKILTDMVNRVLEEDFGLTGITIDSFVGDVLDLGELEDEQLHITRGVVDAVRERIMVRIPVAIGAFGLIEGDETTWDMGTFVHNHRIIGVPLTLEDLDLSGATGVGRITKTTAPAVYRLIYGALGDTPDHCFWIHTRDGAILEAVPAPGKSDDMILAQRDRLGH